MQISIVITSLRTLSISNHHSCYCGSLKDNKINECTKFCSDERKKKVRAQ